MKLVLNIGNTHTQIAELSANQSIYNIRQIPSCEVTNELLQNASLVAAACVVPEIRRQLSCERDIFWLDNQNCGDLTFSNVEPQTVGADRIANALTLKHTYATPALVVDFGTAITLEAVNDQGEFIGGAISPGRMLMRRALNSYTAQLPLLDMSKAIPCYGNNTKNAMLLGIDGGSVGMVKELIERLERNCRYKFKHKVAVGGDRAFFIEQLPEFEDGGDDFTLRGVAFALKAGNISVNSKTSHKTVFKAD